jgi:hypothetical protein
MRGGTPAWEERHDCEEHIETDIKLQYMNEHAQKVDITPDSHSNPAATAPEALRRECKLSMEF